MFNYRYVLSYLELFDNFAGSFLVELRPDDLLVARNDAFKSKYRSTDPVQRTEPQWDVCVERETCHRVQCIYKCLVRNLHALRHSRCSRREKNQTRVIGIVDLSASKILHCRLGMPFQRFGKQRRTRIVVETHHFQMIQLDLRSFQYDRHRFLIREDHFRLR